MVSGAVLFFFCVCVCVKQWYSRATKREVGTCLPNLKKLHTHKKKKRKSITSSVITLPVKLRACKN